MRTFAHCILLLSLAACSQESGRVYAVDEFMADDSLRADVIAACRNNPGELGNTPNCQNAAAADFKARFTRTGKALGG